MASTIDDRGQSARCYRRLGRREAFQRVEGYGVERLFRCLLVQFLEVLSDRELARYLEENLAAKWLCGFTLSEPTSDYW